MTSAEPYPLTLEPITAEQFRGWAGPAFPAGAEFTAGALWLATDNSRSAAGPQAGRGLGYLRQLWGADLVGSSAAGRPDEPLPVELKLQSTGETPLAVALTEDSLWYILAAEEGASLNAGFRPGLDPSRIQEPAGGDPGRWAEFMPEFGAETGRCLNLPRLAPLLLGAGLTVAQIGPPARRLPAWPLPGRGPEDPAAGRPPTWLTSTETGPEETEIFRGPLLTVRLITTARRSDLTDPEAATFIWPLSGQGRVLTNRGPAPTTRLQPGRVVMLPATLGRYAIESGGTINYLLIEAH
ncbi:MAG: hypothetical protein LBV21_01350 [Candidatus Adiutrix sp.]|jgi:hypothetical protein|nr:hypothetical protein [Candidatus Adiutrix sp.]